MLWMMLSETVVPVRISLVPIVSPLTAELFGVRLHSFDSAVEHALRVWEEFEPLSAR